VEKKRKLPKGAEGHHQQKNWGKKFTEKRGILEKGRKGNQTLPKKRVLVKKGSGKKGGCNKAKKTTKGGSGLRRTRRNPLRGEAGKNMGKELEWEKT